MRAILNRQMFTARLFDSGALGVLASVVHQFTEPGRYQVVIRQDDVTKRSIWFEVSESSSNLQLDIDLASTTLPRPSGNDDCECAATSDALHTASTRDVLPTVSPKGYVLFYVSHGEGGYSVRAGREAGDKAVFDSTALGKGDLFALSLLAPTRYAMANRAGKAKGHIVVTMSKEAARNLAALDPVYVEAARDSFSPKVVTVVSGQGIVFRILETSRIVIEQLEAPAGDRESVDRRRFVARRPPEPGKTHAA